MKFGKSLPRNQVPEWSSSYINYKGLKKLITAVAVDQKTRGESDLAPFFFALDRNLENVDAFFNKRLSEAQRRLHLLEGRYGDHFDPRVLTVVSGNTGSYNLEEEEDDRKITRHYGMDRDEMAELLGALLELRSSLRKLQWYGEVNRRGFVKILKKVDKKTNVCAQRRYLESKVLPRPFASAVEAIAAMQTVNSWLSQVGGTEAENENNLRTNITNRPALRRVSSGAAAGISPEIVETVDKCIREDNSATLFNILSEGTDAQLITQKLLLNLLQRAITNRALRCIDLLLGRILTLQEDDDINERNVIHRLVIAIGRSKSMLNTTSTSITPLAGDGPPSSQFPTSTHNFFITPAESPILTPASNSIFELDESLRLSANDESVQLLEYLLNHLKPSQRSALESRDSYGRTALHYGAQYGFVVICRAIIKYMREWGQFDVSDGIDSPKWQDFDGLAPLHLAVIGEHPKTTRMLLQAEHWDCEMVSDKVLEARKTVSKSSAVLALATKANAVAIVELLVEAGVDINYQDEHGETALHHAARLGHVECVKALLEGNETQTADVELAETTYGWTPLFAAAVEGKDEVVDVLMEIGGSDSTKVDLSGWTSQEHAALRGHLNIARKLAKNASVGTATSNSSRSASPPLSSSFEKNMSVGSLTGSLGTSSSSVSTQSQPLKSFGHRYLKPGETVILVTLGSVDTRKNISAVKLDEIPLSEAHSTQLDTALSLVVSAQNAIGEPSIVDLPVHSNISTEDPISFETRDASKVKLMFDIVPTYAGTHKKIIGRAVAVLSSVKPEIGKSKVSLHGCVQVPILALNTLEVIGCVNFEFLVVTPFEHPNMGVTKKQTYWKSLAVPRVIGHRGLGKNFPARKSLQLGENTLQSFIAAANLGASYVEFDVQITKDHVPVIYHDFLVGETGVDAPVHTLTLDQFLSMSEQPKHRQRKGGSSDNAWNDNNVDGNNDSFDTDDHGSRKPITGLRRTRSMSLSLADDRHNNIEDRMKHTRAYKKDGFKGNSRGTSIQGPFATLEQAFKTLPQSVGFNIELKYPMLQESEDEEMDTSVIEMNSWVDAVLKVVYDFGDGRDLIFSSFNPDICLLLSFKQPSIPILFLTEAGTTQMADIRATCLQEAIRFASRWNLLGIVSAVEPLVLCNRLIKVVKESGLVCVTYGVMNNLPENVKLQVDQGVDAVIVDSVLAIRKGLTAGAMSDIANSTITSTKTDDSMVEEEADAIEKILLPPPMDEKGIPIPRKH